MSAKKDTSGVLSKNLHDEKNPVYPMASHEDKNFTLPQVTRAVSLYPSGVQNEVVVRI